MSKNERKTIGDETRNQLDESPFDIVMMPMQRTQKPEQEIKPQIEKTTAKEKERMTVQINKSTIERVKDCVYWNRTTVAQFVEESLEAALIEAEKQNSKPFPKRRSELKPGRPTK